MKHVLLALCLVACGDDGTPNPGIDSGTELDAPVSTSLTVTNLAPDEALAFNLALVRGNALGATVAITNAGETHEWPVVGGSYKALVPLAAGSNTLMLASGGETTTFTLRFVEQTNDHYVRLLWIEAADGDGSFEAPPNIPNTRADGIARVQLAAWMWQTFYAEVMHARGRGRRTFRLLLGTDGRPVVTAARSTKTLAELHALSDVAVWQQLYGDFNGFGGASREKIKDVGVLSFSDWVPESMTMRAGGALGGGHQATMHGANVFTWPATLDAVVAQFSDETVISPTLFSEDSAGRGTVWANYATTTGAVLHELGHTLGLPHAQDYESVMFRGFDHWNRYFMSSEPAPVNGSPLPMIADTDLPVGFVDYEAQWLRYDRWLAHDVAPLPSGGVTIQQSGDTLTITSANGIRAVVFWDRSQTFDADQFSEASPPTTKTYSIAAIRARFPQPAQLGILVRDDRGESAGFDLP